MLVLHAYIHAYITTYTCISNTYIHGAKPHIKDINHTHTQIPVAMRLIQHMLTLNVREPNLRMPALNRN